MPYIPPEQRTKFQPHIKEIATKISNPGELNFVISTILQELLTTKMATTYANTGMLLMELEAAKLEFYRRVMAPHEDAKQAINGDVYGA